MTAGSLAAACGLAFESKALNGSNAHVEGEGVRVSDNSSNSSIAQVVGAFGMGFDIRKCKNAGLPVAEGEWERDSGIVNAGAPHCDAGAEAGELPGGDRHAFRRCVLSFRRGLQD